MNIVNSVWGWNRVHFLKGRACTISARIKLQIINKYLYHISCSCELNSSNQISVGKNKREENIKFLPKNVTNFY